VCQRFRVRRGSLGWLARQRLQANSMFISGSMVLGAYCSDDTLVDGSEHSSTGDDLIAKGCSGWSTQPGSLAQPRHRPEPAVGLSHHDATPGWA